MKIIILTEKLKQSLNIVKNIIGKNMNLPILNSVLLDFNGNNLKISATNLEIGINYYLKAIVEEKGKIAIPVKTFSDFIFNLKDEKIILMLKNNLLNIQSENLKTKLVCFDSKDFPLIPKLKDSNITTLSSRILKNLLSSVLDSISLSQNRPELSGVYMSFTQSNIIVASTDSFRLTERIINQKCSKEISVIIPRNTVLELIRIFSDIDQDISINIDENQIQFLSENFDIVSRLIDGRYPDYKKVIPLKYISKMVYNKEELQNKIKLAGLFTSNINDIGIKVDNKETTIFSKNPDRGEFSAKIKLLDEFEYKIEEPFEVLLNYNYLIDGLKNIPSDKVILKYTGEGAPIIFEPFDKDLKHIYLIMPLRV